MPFFLMLSICADGHLSLLMVYFGRDPSPRYLIYDAEWAVAAGPQALGARFQFL